MQRLLKRLAGLLALLAVTNAAQAGVITKAPDLGTYWGYLSANRGTYIYANSFVADATGAATNLGTWLTGSGSNLVFQIYDSLNGNPAQGPDSAHVLASTATLSELNLGSLTYVPGGPVSSFGNLISGNTYWFAISTLGLGGSGNFSVGGHTQNSDGILDNGSFWFSNYTNGYFDGRDNSPEMAFSVTIADHAVPEPASLVLLALGLLGLRMTRQRRQSSMSTRGVPR